MLEAVTLPDLLDQVATHFPDHGFQFPATGESLDYQTLGRRAIRFARGLQRLGVERGQVTALLFPVGPEFLIAMFGVAAAGVASSPLPWPAMADATAHCERLLRRLRIAGGTAFILAHPSLESTMATALAAVSGGPNGLRLLRLADVEASSGAPDVAIDPDDLAIVQYTSGSTAMPSGVALRHRHVISGLRAICHGLALDSDDVNGQWLPLHHDLGLIGMLAGVACGVRHHIWPPYSFIRNPTGWLAEFARRGCSIYAGPNFSYRQLLARANDALLAGLDLSRWRIAVNGAEPIDARCLEAFIERFRPAGFRPEAMFPVYGLAEATLAATFPDIGEPITIQSVDRYALGLHKKVIHVDRECPHARHIVSVGRPVLGHELRITDDQGRTLASEHVGHIELRGPAIMDGYLGRTPTQSGISADGWLGTGDHGYWSGGRLFVCGRDKEMIIVRGTNYYPQDAERLIADSPGIYRNRCAAFGVERDGHERMAVVVEARPADTEQLRRFAEALRMQIATELDLAEVDVYVVATDVIEYTTSGKARRLAMRERLLAGEIGPPSLLASASTVA